MRAVRSCSSPPSTVTAARHAPRAHRCHELHDLGRALHARLRSRRHSTRPPRRAAPLRSPPRRCRRSRPPASTSWVRRARLGAASQSLSARLPLAGPSNSTRAGSARHGLACAHAPAAARALPAGAGSAKSAASLCSRSGANIAHDLIDRRLRRMARNRHAADAPARRRRELRGRLRRQPPRPTPRTRSRSHPRRPRARRSPPAAVVMPQILIHI